MAEATALPGTPSPGPRSHAIGRLLASRLVVLGGGVLALFVLAAVFAPLFAPHDPVEQDLMLQYVPPFWDERAEPGYPLGTDNLGRDILSRLIYARGSPCSSPSPPPRQPACSAPSSACSPAMSAAGWIPSSPGWSTSGWPFRPSSCRSSWSR